MTYHRFNRRPVQRTPEFSREQMIALLEPGMGWDDRFTPYGMQIVITLDRGTNAEDAKASAERYQATRSGETFKAVPYFSPWSGFWVWAVVALF